MILLWQVLLVSVIMGVLWVTFFVNMPMFETRYWPVVGKLNIEKVEPRGENQTAIYASFEKLRACEYISIAWYRGTRTGSFERVPIATLRDPTDEAGTTRPLGFQKAGPWLINMPATEIVGNSFAELTHKCPGIPWLTTTWFYP